LALVDMGAPIEARLTETPQILGPERVFHVPSRAAAALDHAGAGWPRVLAHWMDLGLVRPEHPDPEHAEARAGWVAHVRLARHLEAEVRGDATGRSFDALVATIRALVDEGRAEAAAELARWALTEERPPDETERLLREAVLAGFERGTEAGLEAALLELERSELEAADLERLLLAGLLAHRDPIRAISAPVPAFVDPDLAFWAEALRVVAARRRHPAEERAVIESLAARLPANPRVRAALASWSAWLGYREGDFDRAARELAVAARGRPRFADQISDLLQAASCAIEAARFADAERWIGEAWAACRQRVTPHFEARCEWLSRSLAWRSGRARSVDAELVRAVEPLRQPNLTGQVALTEAAIARSLGEAELAGELAALAARRFAAAESPVHEALASALGRSLGRDSARGPSHTLRIAMQCGLPRVGAQIAWLEGRASGAPSSWKECYQALRRQVPPGGTEGRAEVLEGLPSLADNFPSNGGGA
jgi:hypothetical protein